MTRSGAERLAMDAATRASLEVQAGLYGVPRADRWTDEILALVGLTAQAESYTRQLSGGMKQKLGLACTLVRSPDLLLLDEPSVGVDPLSRRDLWKIVHQLVEDEGLSVIVSTSYMDEAERCHRINYIAYGRLVTSGTVAEVIADAGLATRTVETDRPGALAAARDPRARGYPRIARPAMPTRTGPPTVSGRWSLLPRPEPDNTVRAHATADQRHSARHPPKDAARRGVTRQRTSSLTQSIDFETACFHRRS